MELGEYIKNHGFEQLTILVLAYAQGKCSNAGSQIPVAEAIAAAGASFRPHVKLST